MWGSRTNIVTVAVKYVIEINIISFPKKSYIFINMSEDSNDIVIPWYVTLKHMKTENPKQWNIAKFIYSTCNLHSYLKQVSNF